MTIKDRLVLVAKVVGILVRDACAAIVPFAVQHKVGLIKIAKGTGLFAAGLYCGLMLRGGNQPVTIAQVSETSPATSTVRIEPASPSPADTTTTPFGANSPPRGEEPSDTAKKKKQRAVRASSAAKKPARSMTLIEFRSRLEALPVKNGVADNFGGADVIKTFGQPDRVWTDTESGVNTGGVNSGPFPVTPTTYSYTYRYLAWKCSDGTIQLKIDADSNTKDLNNSEFVVRDIVDNPAPLQ